jgi:hypothetical protein
MDRSRDDESSALLLKKTDKEILSSEEDIWIQKYLDLGDKVLKPESRLTLEKPKASKA